MMDHILLYQCLIHIQKIYTCTVDNAYLLRSVDSMIVTYIWQKCTSNGRFQLKLKIGYGRKGDRIMIYCQRYSIKKKFYI